MGNKKMPQEQLSPEESPRAINHHKTTSSNFNLPIKQPKLISNVHKLSTLQMLSKKTSFDSTPRCVNGVKQSPNTVAQKTLKSKYKESAQNMARSKRKTKESDIIKASKKQHNQNDNSILNRSENGRKKSCFNLSEILCMNPKKNGAKANYPKP